MNFLITMKCPKQCTFCFSKKLDDVMSLEDYIRYVDISCDRLGQKNIALLGGEPTVHPQLGEMLDYAVTKNCRLNLFSNLLGTKKNIEHVARVFGSYENSAIVWNSSEFDDNTKAQQENCIRNASLLQKATRGRIAHSVTFTKGLNLRYLFSIANLTGVYNIRFALNVFEMDVLSTDEEMEKIVVQLEALRFNGFNINLDRCGFIPSSVSPHLFQRARACFNSAGYCQGNAGGDVMPDGRVMPCMPYVEELKDLYLDEITDMEHMNQLFIKHYGQQARFRQYMGGLCPALFEREKPKETKEIPIVFTKKK